MRRTAVPAVLLAAAALAPIAAAFGPPDGPPLVPPGEAWGWHDLFDPAPPAPPPPTVTPPPAEPSSVEPGGAAPPFEPATTPPAAVAPEVDAPLVGPSVAPPASSSPPLAPGGIAASVAAPPADVPLGPAPPPAESSLLVESPSGAVVATVAAGAVAGVGAGVALWRLPGVRRWLVGLFLPLYARFAGAAVLESDARERIFEHVRAHPGVHFAALKRDLDLRNGVLVHHLRVLERNGYLRSAMDGNLRRWFVAEGKVPEGAPPLSQQVYRFVATHPAATSAEVAFALSKRPTLVHYHVAKLTNAGQLRREKVGREVRLWAI